MGHFNFIAIWIFSAAVFSLLLYKAMLTSRIFLFGTPFAEKIKSYYISPGLKIFFERSRFYENVEYEKDGAKHVVRVEFIGTIRPGNAARTGRVYRGKGRTWDDLGWDIGFALVSLIMPMLVLQMYLPFNFFPFVIPIFYLGLFWALLPAFFRLFCSMRKLGLRRYITRGFRIHRIVHLRNKQRKADYFSYRRLLALRGQNISAQQARNFMSDLGWVDLVVGLVLLIVWESLY